MRARYSTACPHCEAQHELYVYPRGNVASRVVQRITDGVTPARDGEAWCWLDARDALAGAETGAEGGAEN